MDTFIGFLVKKYYTNLNIRTG